MIHVLILNMHPNISHDMTCYSEYAHNMIYYSKYAYIAYLAHDLMTQNNIEQYTLEVE